ncbi:hypothetical protein ACLJCF_09145, partial [Campylobacter coli]|uniref:hypothetical protein n=1 Tax=Campylobacter coli TaxID=195 RepID=UPI003F7C63D0
LKKLKTKSLEDKNMHLIKVHIYSYYYLLIVTINNKNFLIFINNIANNKIFLKGEDEIIYSRKT